MLHALDTLMRAGKIRYFGVSNYSGWHLMKMIALADRHGLPRPVSHQAYYSLVGREFEWELMPLALDQKVGTLVWSPLASAKLSGKVGRNKPAPAGSRAGTDASLDIPEERSVTRSPTRSISWRRKPAVRCRRSRWRGSSPAPAFQASSSARATRRSCATISRPWEFKLTPDQIAKLDAASNVRPIYPLLAPARDPCRHAIRRRC